MMIIHINKWTPIFYWSCVMFNYLEIKFKGSNVHKYDLFNFRCYYG